MNTTPINQNDCAVAGGLLHNIFISPVANVTAMGEPIIDNTKHSIGSISHTDPFTRLAPFDTEAEYRVSLLPSPSGDMFKAEVSLMLSKFSEAYFAALNSVTNQDLVIVAMVDDNTILVFGSKDQPMRLSAESSSNKQLAETPGSEIMLSCTSYYRPLHYTGSPSHPGGDPDKLTL